MTTYSMATENKNSQVQLVVGPRQCGKTTQLIFQLFAKGFENCLIIVPSQSMKNYLVDQIIRNIREHLQEMLDTTPRFKTLKPSFSRADISRIVTTPERASHGSVDPNKFTTLLIDEYFFCHPEETYTVIKKFYDRGKDIMGYSTPKTFLERKVCTFIAKTSGKLTRSEQFEILSLFEACTKKEFEELYTNSIFRFKNIEVHQMPEKGYKEFNIPGRTFEQLQMEDKGILFKDDLEPSIIFPLSN